MIEEVAAWVNGRSTLKAKLVAGTTHLYYVMKPGTVGRNCHHFAFSAFQGAPGRYAGGVLYGEDGTARPQDVSAHDDTLLMAPGWAGRAMQRVRLYWLRAPAAGWPDHSARREVHGGLFWHRLMSVHDAVIGFEDTVTEQDLGYAAVEEINVLTVCEGLAATAQQVTGIDYANISPCAGWQCYKCRQFHDRFSGGLFGKWYKCQTCNVIYCYMCGGLLDAPQFGAKERTCDRIIKRYQGDAGRPCGGLAPPVD